jgi:AhpD family alkylhydroperoxidase
MTFDKRIVELIALGASVAVNCQPCLQFHISEVLKVGITEPEIKGAIQVGRTVRKGAAHKLDQFVSNMMEDEMIISRGGGEGCGCR